MPNIIVEHCYEEIKFLTAKIGELGLVEEVIESAKAQSKKKMEIIFEKFKKDNPEVGDRLFEFYEDTEITTIFSRDKTLDESDELIEYDPSIINPRNLCVLFALSNNNVDESDIFEDWSTLQKALYNARQLELAEYLCDNTISEVDDLIKAFA